jgi:hypothetical protein
MRRRLSDRRGLSAGAGGIERRLGRARGHVAEVDADNGPRTRPDEGDVVQSVPALQVHHLGCGSEGRPEQVALDPEQRRARSGLSQKFLILADVFR